MGGGRQGELLVDDARLDQRRLRHGIDHVLAADRAAQLFDHGPIQRHQASGASRSGLCSKASKRRVVALGSPGASMASAPTISKRSQRRHSSSEGARSVRSKIASLMRLCGETWIVYQTESPSAVTT